MIAPELIYNILSEEGVEFFTGVPDSLLKNFSSYISANAPKDKHITAANEGGALALAAGYHLATGKIPLVYMQNSGLGNIINPLLSLTDTEVYAIPVILMIGWRGMPGVKDEPQHIKQGRVQNKLLQAMEIPYEKLSSDTEDPIKLIRMLIDKAQSSNSPVALIVEPNTFEKYEYKCQSENLYEMTREDAIKEIIRNLGDDSVVVSTTGKASREVYEYREERGDRHEKDFLTVGSMGHASQIALGIALNTSKRVICLDGDGALLMHMGALGLTGTLKPENLVHIILNNACHDSVGGQPTCASRIDFTAVASSSGYNLSLRAETREELNKALNVIKDTPGPALLEVRLKRGSRSDLGRPKETPVENKKALMKFLACCEDNRGAILPE